MKKATPNVDKCLQHIQQILSIRPDGMDFTDIIDTTGELNLHDTSTITPDSIFTLLNTESSNPDGSIILEGSKYKLREQSSKSSPLPCRRRLSSPGVQVSNPSKRSRIRAFSPSPSSPSGPTGSPGSHMAYHLDRMNLDEDTDSAEESTSWRIISSPRPRRRRIESPNTSPQGSPSRRPRGRSREINSELEPVQVVFPSSSPPSTPPPSTSHLDELAQNSFDTAYPSPSSPQQKKERRLKRAEQLRKLRAREAREAREDRARKRGGEIIEEEVNVENNGKKVGFAMEDIKVFVYEGEEEEEEEEEEES